MILTHLLLYSFLNGGSGVVPVGGNSNVRGRMTSMRRYVGRR